VSSLSLSPLGNTLGT
jgi:hypothetical protein